MACSVDADSDEVFFICRLAGRQILLVEREWKILYNPSILAPGNNTKL